MSSPSLLSVDNEGHLVHRPAHASDLVRHGCISRSRGRNFRHSPCLVNGQANIEEEFSYVWAERRAGAYRHLHIPSEACAHLGKDKFIGDTEFQVCYEARPSITGQVALFLSSVLAHEKELFREAAFLVHPCVQAIIHTVEYARNSDKQCGLHEQQVLHDGLGTLSETA
jgi:hypothetical protein